MRTRSKLALTALAGAVGLAAAEALVRVLRLGPPPIPVVECDLWRRSADPRLRFEALPGGTERTTFLDRGGEPVRVVVTQFNAQGFRGPVTPTEKTEGTFRIACLGDSQTFGTSVGEGEPWPARLEAALRERRPDLTLEVMNCGVPGYEPEQEVVLLETRVLAFDPDLVILAFFMNDTVLPGVEVEPPDERLESLFDLLAPGRPGILPGLRRRSKLVDLCADGLQRWLAVRGWVGQRGALFADGFEGWVRARAAVRRARDLVAARGSRFAVLLVPVLLREGGELLSTEPYRRVARFCSEEGIPCFDPAVLFAGVDVDRLRVSERNLHCGAEAHRTIGEGAALWIQDQVLVGVRATAAPDAR